MPIDKDLKRLVRARMAATRENDTTASRPGPGPGQVLVQRSAMLTVAFEDSGTVTDEGVVGTLPRIRDEVADVLVLLEPFIGHRVAGQGTPSGAGRWGRFHGRSPPHRPHLTPNTDSSSAATGWGRFWEIGGLQLFRWREAVTMRNIQVVDRTHHRTREPRQYRRPATAIDRQRPS